MTDFREVIRSTALWAIVLTLGLFSFLTWGARPALHMLGLLFGLMGGQGLEGTDL